MHDATGAPKDRFLRDAEVEARTGLRKSARYERIRGGTFPAPIKLGRRCSVWSELAINAWIEARKSEAAHPSSKQARG